MTEDESDRHFYRRIVSVQTEEEATQLIEEAVARLVARYDKSREEALQIVRSDIGYYGGYCTHEERARIERLFKVEHPFFGSIERDGPPSLEQAFAMGQAWSEHLERKNQGLKDD